MPLKTVLKPLPRCVFENYEVNANIFIKKPTHNSKMLNYQTKTLQSSFLCHYIF